jgi:hypothetical protein
MTILVFALFRPTETGLKREGVDDPIFLVKHYSSCRLLPFRHSESTVFERERWIVLTEKVWEHSFLVLSYVVNSIFIAASKHEGILLSRVPMAVDIEEDLP